MGQKTFVEPVPVSGSGGRVGIGGHHPAEWKTLALIIDDHRIDDLRRTSKNLGPFES